MNTQFFPPVSTCVPDDVLCLIFYQIIPDLRTIHRISLVSKQWRAVSTGYPLLWANIIDQHPTWHVNYNLLLKSLQLSKPTELTIKLNLKRWKRPINLVALGILFSHLDRTTHFEVIAGVDDVEHLLQRKSLRASSLRSWIWKDVDDLEARLTGMPEVVRDVVSFATQSTLRSLEDVPHLRDVAFFWATPLDDSKIWDNKRFIQITHQSIRDIDAYINLISRSPELEELKLKTRLEFSHSYWTRRPIPLEMPWLNRLELIYCSITNISQFLDSVSMPNLKHLAIRPTWIANFVGGVTIYNIFSECRNLIPLLVDIATLTSEFHETLPPNGAESTHDPERLSRPDQRAEILFGQSRDGDASIWIYLDRYYKFNVKGRHGVLELFPYLEELHFLRAPEGPQERYNHRIRTQHNTYDNIRHISFRELHILDQQSKEAIWLDLALHYLETLRITDSRMDNVDQDVGRIFRPGPPSYVRRLRTLELYNVTGVEEAEVRKLCEKEGIQLVWTNQVNTES
ncbi:hypothetical protein M422DRAFT_23270 [Sphaerobolus stellatus SS14]|nr:hypothetical protein M422DRAFT_23270 [Sphaerobolus stellatus SS14]